MGVIYNIIFEMNLQDFEIYYKFENLRKILNDLIEKVVLGDRMSMPPLFIINNKFDKKCPFCENINIKSDLIEKNNMFVCEKCDLAFDKEYYELARKLYLEIYGKEKKKINEKEKEKDLENYKKHKEEIDVLKNKIEKEIKEKFDNSIRFLSDKHIKLIKKIKEVAKTHPEKVPFLSYADKGFIKRFQLFLIPKEGELSVKEKDGKFALLYDYKGKKYNFDDIKKIIESIKGIEKDSEPKTYTNETYYKIKTKNRAIKFEISGGIEDSLFPWAKVSIITEPLFPSSEFLDEIKIILKENKVEEYFNILIVGKREFSSIDEIEIIKK